MPIRGSPDGARHPRPQVGRDPPEWVVAINRNAWSQSIGIPGRDHPVRAHFGLGTAERAEIRIKWPDGDCSNTYKASANNFVRIDRLKPAASYWLAPPADGLAAPQPVGQ
jgi:hypothetical protein